MDNNTQNNQEGNVSNTYQGNNFQRPNIQNSTSSVGSNTMMYDGSDSYFDGKLLQLIGWRILGAIVTTITFGLCFPWAICKVIEWETKHTVIGGMRLYFDGRALQLFGNILKWTIFTLITFGIFSLWLPIVVKKWKIKHTHFE